MASPVPKFPKIMDNLKKRGYTLQVGSEEVKTEIMRETGTCKEAGLSLAFAAMVRLGYLRDSGRGSIFFICQKEPYNFPQEKKETVKEIGDKYGV